MAAKMTSRVKWVQKIIEKIQGIKAPAWYVDLMGDMQDVFLNVLYQIGKEQLEAIKNKVIEVAESEVSNEEKFQKVFDYARTIRINLKDSVLRALIEAIVVSLKRKKVIN